jgi:hypothetical protein
MDTNGIMANVICMKPAISEGSLELRQSVRMPFAFRGVGSAVWSRRGSPHREIKGAVCKTHFCC